MTHVEIKNEEMTPTDKTQFLIACGRSLEKVTASAPSDSLVTMVVDYDGDDYFVSFDLISGDLSFTAVGTARSPFVALEKANKDSMDRISKWTLSRKIETAS
ncbi:hypothetical protein [Bdellovibrio bacteriovorus]|uniref:hypothetical protein n=1 Tax=Bdellovibrio bacteriovorus TaxID=959 RepID=UPI0035A5C1FC